MGIYSARTRVFPSELNANPRDTKDYPQGVWTLPPSYRLGAEDHDKYAEMNKYYAKFFPEDPPARTTLGVAQVPGPSRLEITCIAYTDLAEKKRIVKEQADVDHA